MSQAGSLTEPLYTAEAKVEGGRLKGRGRALDGAIDIRLAAPRELGGNGEGTNPEQLFAIAYGACFASAIDTAARRMQRVVGDVVVDSKVSLIRGSDRSFSLGVALDVQLPAIADDDEAVELVTRADGICPYSRATRGNIPVRLTSNGVRVNDEDAAVH